MPLGSGEVPGTGTRPGYWPQGGRRRTRGPGARLSPERPPGPRTGRPRPAASGLRSGEALGLDRADVKLDAAVLTVTGKNGLGRLVPLHPSAAAMLARYAARRDALCPQLSPAFFVIRTGRNVLPDRPGHGPRHRLHWSAWRGRHQHRARTSHYQKRTRT
jgi:integrase